MSKGDEATQMLASFVTAHMLTNPLVRLKRERIDFEAGIKELESMVTRALQAAFSMVPDTMLIDLLYEVQQRQASPGKYSSVHGKAPQDK
jgi:hypothetical protein